MTDNELARQLLSAMNRTKQLHMRKLRPGLNKGEHMMLFSIWDAGSGKGGCVQASQLSEAQRISKPAISQMLNSLEKKGMIERIPDEKDRRVVHIKVTEQGMEEMDKAWKSVNQMVDFVVERLGEDDTQTLIKLVNKLYSIFDEMIEKGLPEEFYE